ncbi:hypothetical protein Q4566_09200 [Tamlana sp. 2_MG-2023]|uniref:hypothetical protein n=1 Tax=unclassified Tamlana TaxID=2614803 RepID=UPI0026E16C61|nr:MULTISPECIES: hypothetical protein [unclassified Tamlana]MDO6760371.1 hypothetical protein [Tamlana sp. 2_MG-2023]MDO6789931.1 hypothetical protein [Tamlana sp. 1_MG-2023]
MGLIDAINETNTKAVNVSERYIDSSYKFYRLKFFKHFSISVSLLFKTIIVGSLVLMCAMLSAVALALYIGELTGNYPLGFLLVGVGFMVLSIIAYLFRGTINNMVIKKLSNFFFD